MELFVGLVFASVFTLLFASSSLTGRRPLKKRLARLADGSRAVVAESDGRGLLPSQHESLLTKLLAPLAGKASRGDSSANVSVGRTRQRLVEAGFRHSSALTLYMGSRVALALGLPVIALLLSPAWSLDELQLVMLLCVSAGLGLVAPSYWLDRMRGRRQQQIILGLPDALDLMVVCVEAGLGVNASLARVAKEFALTNPVLSAEFELVTLEARAGKSSTEALRSLAERTGVSEVSSLVAMLVQTERFGTSIADTLRVFADSMRVQRMLRAEEQGGKAPVKMLFPTLIIFVATLVVTIGPGLMQMFAFFEEGQ
jgi:tight adherence protein C